MDHASGQPADVARALEGAALAVGRLDAALDGHPLLPAWQHWVRLEAVRRHAALDGCRVDPHRLAALIEGLRLRPFGTAALHERGADHDGLNHALLLYGFQVAAADRRPERELDATTDAVEHRRLVEAALWRLSVPAPGARIAGLALAARGWIADDRPRGALRAAVPAALQAAGLSRALLPLLAGADALRPDGTMEPAGWTLAFARGLEREAEDGRDILRRLEHGWRQARARLGPRRRHSRLPAAVDLLAAAPLLGPARLAALLGCSVRGAAKMLAELAARGAAVEVSGRASHQLYGLAESGPIRAETAGPRRHGARRGRPPKPREPAPEPAERAPPPVALPPATPARLEPLAIDYAALDALLADTNRVIERVQGVLRRRTS